MSDFVRRTLAGSGLGDLYSLDLSSGLWADLTPSMLGSIPSPRMYHGFAAHRDRLYVMGGTQISDGGDGYGLHGGGGTAPLLSVYCCKISIVGGAGPAM